MSVIFSRQCEYALQAVSYLALKPPGTHTSIKEMTKKLGVPYHFLGKILQDLTNKGMLTSQKGPNGGFALAKRPEKITLLDIVEAIDGLDLLHKCVMGFPSCSDSKPCAVHKHWAEIRAEIHRTLKGQHILDVARAMKKPEYHP